MLAVARCCAHFQDFFDRLARRNLLSYQLRLIFVASVTRNDQESYAVTRRRRYHFLPIYGCCSCQLLHSADQIRPDVYQLACFIISRQISLVPVAGGNAEFLM